MGRDITKGSWSGIGNGRFGLDFNLNTGWWNDFILLNTTNGRYLNTFEHQYTSSVRRYECELNIGSEICRHFKDSHQQAEKTKERRPSSSHLRYKGYSLGAANGAARNSGGGMDADKAFNSQRRNKE